MSCFARLIRPLILSVDEEPERRYETNSLSSLSISNEAGSIFFANGDFIFICMSTSSNKYGFKQSLGKSIITDERFLSEGRTSINEGHKKICEIGVFFFGKLFGFIGECI